MMPCTQGWPWVSAGFGAPVQQQRVLVPSPRRTGLLGVAESRFPLATHYAVSQLGDWKLLWKWRRQSELYCCLWYNGGFGAMECGKKMLYLITRSHWKLEPLVGSSVMWGGHAGGYVTASNRESQFRILVLLLRTPAAWPKADLHPGTESDDFMGEIRDTNSNLACT